MRTNKCMAKEGLIMNEVSEVILEKAIKSHASDIFIFPEHRIRLDRKSVVSYVRET